MGYYDNPLKANFGGNPIGGQPLTEQLRQGGNAVRAGQVAPSAYVPTQPTKVNVMRGQTINEGQMQDGGAPVGNLTGQIGQGNAYSQPSQISSAFTLGGASSPTAPTYASPVQQQAVTPRPSTYGDYPAATTTQPPAAYHAPDPTGIAANQGQYQGNIEREIAARQAAQQSLISQFTAMQNPYGLDSQAFQTRLGLDRDAVSRNFGGVQSQIAGQAGARGIGVNNVQGALSRAFTNQARALSDVRRQDTSEAIDKGVSFEQNRMQGLERVNSGDYSGALGAYGGLLNNSTSQYNADRNFNYGVAHDAVTDGQNQQRIELTAQEMKNAIARGDQATASQLGQGLLNFIGKTATDPAAQAAVAKLLASLAL